VIFPRLTGRLIARFVPHRLTVQALDLAWHNGYAWGFTEASLCWLTFLVVVLILVLALRARR
jgi:hypothetical protein